MRSLIGGRLLSAALAAAMTSGLLVVGAVAGSAPALAVQPAQDTLVSDDPADFTPHVLDGEVKAIAVLGDTVVLGGDFNSARDDFGGPVLVRRNILAFDRTTGLISDDFAPVIDDSVRSLAPAPDGQSVYVGGQFGSVNGTATFKVARLDIATGAKVPGFNAGVVNAVVYDLKLANDRLFIAGQFTEVAGQPRSLLAELAPSTGALAPTTWPAFTGLHNPDSPSENNVTHLEKIDVNPDGETLVAIGNFTTVGDSPRNQAAMLATAGGPATGWSTTQYEALCLPAFTQYVTDVEYSPDGEYFVISTTGGYMPPPLLCDTVTRWDADRRTSGAKPTWSAYTGGDSNYSVAVTGVAIYVGGHERWFNNPDGNNAAGPGAVSREGIAALDPDNGLPLSWNPTRDRGRGVFDMVATADGLWVGNDTTVIGNEFHSRIAYFPLAGGTVVPNPAPPPLPVDAYVLRGTAPVEQWMFDGETPGEVLPATIDGVTPNTVTGGFWLDRVLFLSAKDKTLTARPYDGEVTGPVTTLDLHGLTSFADELAQMTGLFYTEGRIVYTLKKDSRMYSRYFSPESGVVGNQRFTVPAGGVDWKQARGMFLSDGGLYWSQKSTGDLHRVSFGARGPKAGTDVIVSGPTDDGRDWTATAMFALAPPPPNEAPTAAFDVSCVGPTCTFDAASSVDSDGQITDYAWDFGDGTTGSGVQTEHLYGGPGDYTVTLTVTDNDLATGSTTGTASVVVSEISFVGSARHADDTTKTVQTLVLPAGIQAGDQLVMTESYNAGTGNNPPVTVSDPAGWERVAQTSTPALTTVVWTRTAVDGLSETTVTTNSSGLVRSSLLVNAYRDAVIQPGGIALVGETTSRADHTTPVLPAPDGSWVLSSWEDKTGATTMWTPPAGEVVRQTGTQAGTRVSWLLTDTGGPVPAGDVGGKTAVAQTATGDSLTANATMLTVVLAPAP